MKRDPIPSIAAAAGGVDAASRALDEANTAHGDAVLSEVQRQLPGARVNVDIADGYCAPMVVWNDAITIDRHSRKVSGGREWFWRAYMDLDGEEAIGTGDNVMDALASLAREDADAGLAVARLLREVETRA